MKTSCQIENKIDFLWFPTAWCILFRVGFLHQSLNKLKINQAQIFARETFFFSLKVKWLLVQFQVTESWHGIREKQSLCWKKYPKKSIHAIFICFIFVHTLYFVLTPKYTHIQKKIYLLASINLEKLNQILQNSIYKTKRMSTTPKSYNVTGFFFL